MINTSNIKNYKPKGFAELTGVSVKTLQRWDREGTLKANRIPLHVFSCRQYGLRKYKKQIKEDREIAEELQNRNKSDAGTEVQN